jgi:hypothetical protein
MNITHTTLASITAYRLTLADGKPCIFLREGVWQGMELLRRIDKPEQTIVVERDPGESQFARIFRAASGDGEDGVPFHIVKASPDLLAEMTAHPAKEPA